jgi:hypothetical protein
MAHQQTDRYGKFQPDAMPHAKHGPIQVNGTAMPNNAKIDATTLGQWLDEYRKEYGPRLEEYLGYYKRVPIENAIREAVLGKGGKIHPHQFHVGEVQLRELAAKLLKRDKIKAIEDHSCKTFDQLHRFIETNAVRRFGKLAVYDTALRLGFHLGCPPSDVYLHAGSTRTWNAISGKPFVDIAKWHDVPEPLKELNAAYHVQHFLCVFKVNTSTASGGDVPIVGKDSSDEQQE